MVAIVSGNNMGLFNTSAGVLSQYSLGGGAVHGNSREAAYVNVFNGNLALQDGDGFLASNGINLALTRTYNSQAALSDATNNGWQDVLLKQVKLIGTLNDPASTVQRIDADGSVSTFRLKDSSVPNVYFSTDGDGGYQTLTFTAGTSPSLGQWTWTSDRSDLLGPYEIYDMNQAGYIVKAGDQVAVRQTYTYTKVTTTTPATYQLNKVTDAAGDSMTFTYTGANLTKVTVTPASGTGTAYTITYAYDAQNRLKTVTLVRDGLTYATNYTYAADVNGTPSQLVAEISQSDGSRMGFTYDANGRVKSYTLYSATTGVVGQTTSFTYNGNSTTVTDPLQNTVTYSYDGAGQLTSVETQGAGKVSYAYDSQGNVLSVTDGRGLVTSYVYDANGNRIKQTDAAGNVVTRIYGGTGNLLLSETTYRNIGGDPSLAAPQTTRYTYDKFNRLRYTVSPEGRVTEYVYPEAASATVAAQVQYSATRTFTVSAYTLPADYQAPIALAALDTWSKAQVTATNYTQTNYTYNTRGLVSQTVTVNADGATTASTVTYTYDSAGKLLTATTASLNNKTTYTYDGLGRQLTKVVSNASGQVSSASTSYGLNSSTVTETLYGASTTQPYATNVYTYDSAGELLSVQSNVTGVTSNSYDADGQLRISTSAGGQKTYWLYDSAGRKVAEIDATGTLTELVYNQNNQVVRTIRYATELSAANLLALQGKDANGVVLNMALASVRPAASALDRSSWNFYDKAGRLADNVDSGGYITHYDYDGSSRLTQTTLRSKPLATSALSALTLDQLLKMDGIPLAASANANEVKQVASSDDRSSTREYDKDGLLTAEVDALGKRTDYRYNAAGLHTQTITRGEPADIYEYRVYDSQNRLAGTVDGEGYLTELTYDVAGNVIKRTTYANKSTAPDGAELSVIRAAIPTNTSVNNRVISYTYDAAGRVLTETNSFAYMSTTVVNWVNTYTYDATGKLASVAHNTGGTTSSKTYDGQGRVLTETAGVGAQPTRYTYDVDGLLVKKTDPGNGVTVYYYDDDGRLTYTINALGHVEKQSYNNFGQVIFTRSFATLLTPETLAGLTGGRDRGGNLPVRTQSANDQRTLFYYDAAGRLSYTVAADGAIEGRSYTSFGELKSTVRYAQGIGSAAVLAASTDQLDSSVSSIINNASLKNQVSSFTYDKDGRLVYSVDPAGNAQSKSYDDFGNVASLTQLSPDGKNSVQSYAYNMRGQVIDYTDALGNHTVTAYNAFGEAVMQSRRATAGSTAASALDSVTRILYDENGRVGARIDPLGYATFYQYNGDGNVVFQATYAVNSSGIALTAAQLATIDGQLLNGVNASTPVLETVRALFATPMAREQFVYDTRGRVTMKYTAQSGNLWTVTSLGYDENDNLVSRVTYAKTVSNANPIGTTPPPKPAFSVNDRRERMIYDAVGRLTDTLTAMNTVNSAGDAAGVDGSPITPTTGAKTNWSLVSLQYDAFGNVVQRTAFGAPLAVATITVASLDTAVPTPADIAALKGAASMGNAVTVYRYDSANRVVTSATAQGIYYDNVMRWAAVGYEYNAAGLLSKKIEYGHDAAALPGTSPFDPQNALPVPDSSVDRATSYEYDLANRLVKTIDALNNTVSLEYDARGNVVKTTQYSATDGKSRVTRTVYDLNNQPVYQIDAAGHVTQNTYDALGKVAASTEYATPVDLSKLATTTVDKLVAAIPARDRTVRYIYDQDGQLRFTVDAAGFLTQQTYDGLGRPLASVSYMASVAAKFATGYTLANALAAVSSAGTARTTTRTYDAMGNVTAVTDPLNGVERYTYDAQGNKLSYTNQLGAIWYYTYDAANHLIAQIDPATVMYAEGANADSTGTSVSLVTKMRYDALGNMVSRTEAGRSTTPRVTTYGYDLVGRQILTVLPEVAVYNAGAAADANGRTESAKSTHTIEVLYDAQGNAVLNEDVGGQRSYKVYDKLGRVIYDIDATGYISRYERNGFGDVIRFTRYAQPLTYGEQYEVITYHRLPVADRSSPEDRTITTTYDELGRISTVSEPAAAVYDQQTQSSYTARRTTRTEYDEFGAVASQSVYGVRSDGSTTAAAVTRYYYDVRGNRTAQILALSSEPGNLSGYLTTYDYDAQGNQTSVKEYASAIQNWSASSYSTPAAAAADRETTYQYDANRRKIVETKVGALAPVSGSGAGTNIVTSYAYDAVGNQVSAAITGGVTTKTFYDTLGRVIAVAQLAPSGDSTVMPVTFFKLDAYGNVLVRTDYIDGGTWYDEEGYPLSGPPIVNTGNPKNRTVITSYDIAGHATKVVDANGKASFVSYDVYGRAAKQWRTVTNSPAGTTETWYQLNEYDKLGRLVDLTTPGNTDLVNGTAAQEIKQHYEYNAFGEAIRLTTTSGGLSKSEYIDYDNAGRIWRTNRDDGVDKVTLYDAQGNATVQIRSTNTDQARLHELKELGSAVAALSMANIQRTDTRYDLMGRAVDVRQSTGTQMYVMVHDAYTGGWSAKPAVTGSALGNALLVVGSANDAGQTITVQHRLKGSAQWSDQSPTRMQVINGTPVFSTAGLGAGDYEYRITVQPQGEPAYQRESGTFSVSSVTGADQDKPIIQLFVMLLGRLPDMTGVNFFLNGYNNGGSLAQITAQFLSNPEALQKLPADTTALIKQIMLGVGRNGSNAATDPTYASDVAYWVNRYNAANAAARPQVILDFIETLLNPVNPSPAQASGKALADLRVQAGLEYLKAGGNSQDTANKLYQDAITNPAAVLQDATRLGKEEARRSQIAQIYLALLRRPPLQEEMNAAMAGGSTPEQIVGQVLASADALSPLLYPKFAGQSEQDYTQRVIYGVYWNILGHLPSAAEYSAALAAMAQITDPNLKLSQFTLKLIHDTASYTGVDAVRLAQKQLFNNRLAVALSYMAVASPNKETAKAVGESVINSVTGTGSAAAAVASAVDNATLGAALAQSVSNAANAAATANQQESMQMRIARLYAALLNRAPDSVGFINQVEFLRTQGNTEAGLALVAQGFLDSAEAHHDASLTAVTMVNGVLVPLTDAQFVDQVYKLALGTVPTSAGAIQERQRFVAQLPGLSRGQVAVNIITGMLSFQGLTPEESALKAKFNNKAAVGLVCATDLAQFNWPDTIDTTVAKGILAQVTATDTQTALASAYQVAQASIARLSAANIAAANAATAALSTAAAAALAAYNAGLALPPAAAAAAAQPTALLRLQIMQIYVGIMGRSAASYLGSPDVPGFNFQVNSAAGMTLDAVLQNMLANVEGQQTYPPGMSNSDFVTKVFNTMLGAGLAAPEDIAYWTAQMPAKSRAQVAVGILDFIRNYEAPASTPAAQKYLAGKKNFYQNVAAAFTVMDTQQQKAADDAAAAVAPVLTHDTLLAGLLATKNSTAAASNSAIAAANNALSAANSQGDGSAATRYQLTLLYATVLQRTQGPTFTEMNYYTSGGGKGSLQSIAQLFIDSAEARNAGLYPADNDGFIRAVYQNILGRQPNPDEVAYWRTQLVNNVGAPYARGTLAVNILNNLLNYSEGYSFQLAYKTQLDQKVSTFLAWEQSDAQAAANTAQSAYNTAQNNTANAASTLSTATTKRDNARAAADAAAAAATEADSILAYAANQKIVTRIFIGLRGYSDYTGVAFYSRNMVGGAVPGVNLIDELLAAQGYPSDPSGFIQTLYSRVLGRTPSAADVNWWVNNLAGTTRADIANQFLTSAEATQRLGTTINNQVAADIQTSKELVAARTSTASAYSSAQSAYNTANTAYNNAYSAEQTASATANTANRLARSVDALRAAQLNVVTADQSYYTAALASEKHEVEKAKNDQLHVTYAAQLAANAAAQPAAVADHAALALANANAALASAKAAVGAANISDQAAPLAEQRIKQIAGLYVAVLNRAPTLAEALFWTDKMAATGNDLGPDIVAALMTSPGGAALYPAGMSNDAFVTQLYRFALDRDFGQDTVGLRYWSDKLSPPNPISRASLAAAFVKANMIAGNGDTVRIDNRTADALRAMAAEVNNGGANLLPSIQLAQQAQRAASGGALPTEPNAQKVTLLTRLYVGLMNRLPDATGIAFWFNELQQGGTLSQIAQKLLSSGEAITLYPAGQSNRDFLMQVFTTGMGRVPSDAEIATYVSRAASTSRADAVVAMLNDIADGATSTMQQDATRAVFNAKVQDGVNYLVKDIVRITSNSGTTQSALAAIKAANPVDNHADDLVLAVNSNLTGSARLNSGPDQIVLDRWGNVLVQRDARDANWTTTYSYNDAGQVLSTVSSGRDGTISTANAYDQNGKLIQTTDGRGYINKFKYDANGALLSETHADYTSGQATITYTNDAFGQHLRMQQNVTGSSTGAVITNYSYDNMGNQLTRESASVALYWWNGTTESTGTGSMVVRYAYDELGRRISTTNTVNGAAALADPNKTVTTYARYDLSGNVIRTTNELGQSTLSTYDAFNHKVAEKAADGKVKTWLVDSFGHASASTDLGANQTQYRYNAAGQLIRQFNATQNLTYSYDPVTGQVSSITDSALGLLTTYTYDAAGNRATEKVWSQLENRALQDHTLRYDTFNRLSTIVSTVPGANYSITYVYDNSGNRTQQLTKYTDDAGVNNTIDIRYGYDSMNRVNVITGTDNGVAIQAHNINYNWMGNRVSDTAAGVGETYTYDTAGRLVTISSSKGTITQRYDSGGRIISVTDTGKDEIRYNKYDQAGRLVMQRVTGYAGTKPLKNIVEYIYDGAGNMSQTVVTASDNKTKQTTTYYYNGSNLLDSTTVVNSTGEAKSSVQFYDANNNVRLVQQRDGNGNVIESTSYLTDASSHVLEKRTGSDVTHSLFVNEQLIGSSSNSYETFSSVYDAANSAEANNQPTVYVVRAATETLQSIAKAVWGDERLWYLIDEANGGIDGKLVAGQQLVIPTRVNEILNGYNTYKPYNQSNAIGDTKPELALAVPSAQGGGGGCGVVGKLIMVVVAVAVTYVTAGAAASAFGSSIFGEMATAAVGAAAGSAASQAVGIAIGAQDSFSWKAVARAGLQAGITAGIGQIGDFKDMNEALSKQGWAGTAASAAINNVVSQGIANVTGLQRGFSWAGVAGSFIGSSVASGLQQSSWFNGLQQSTASMAINTISGTAAGLTRSVIAGGKVKVTQIATDAFGNAIGSSLVDAYRNSDSGRLSQTLNDINARRSAAGLDSLDQNDPELMSIVKGIANAGSERLTADRLDRYRDKLYLSGVNQTTADDAVDHLTQAFMPKGSVTAVAGDNLSAINTAILTGQNPAEHGTAFGLDIADTVMRKTGGLVQGFGGFIKDNPVAMYALEGIDFAAGPAVYAARKVLTNLTPVGEILENAQSAVTSKIADRFTSVGYNDTDAIDGGVGGLTLMLTGATGLAGAAAKLGTFVPTLARSGASGASELDQAARAAMRARVEANIVQSAAARNTSRFDVHVARADQVRWGYAADEWSMTQLKAGDKVIGGLPGQSAYYTTQSTLDAANGSRAALFESLQVKPHPEFGYRPKVGEYEVIQDVSVPFGKVGANPLLGAGQGDQFFINNFGARLRLVREIPLRH